MKTILLTLTVLLAAFGVSAQTKSAPDLGAGGVQLFDRASAKKRLEGFQARIAPDGRPVYYFFNRGGTQVLKLTGESFDDRFLITEVEVYRIDKSYTQVHFVDEETAVFRSTNDFFVGYFQSKTSAILGIPNVDGKDEVGPKTVLKKLGEPTSKAVDGKNETFTYEKSALELTDDAGVKKTFRYTAVYEFRNGKLRRFQIAVTTV